jgi:hypothetical protein
MAFLAWARFERFDGKEGRALKKCLGMFLLIVSGFLVCRGYDTYQGANAPAKAVNDSALGKMVQIKMEVPKEVYLYGGGALVALLAGVVLILKKT